MRLVIVAILVLREIVFNWFPCTKKWDHALYEWYMDCKSEK